MEILLNLAWVICSVALFWFWTRTNASNPVPRRLQVLALAMVVLLLLPVISLSDDLMAMQGASETDMSLRKAQLTDDAHASPAPTLFGLPEQIAAPLVFASFSRLAAFHSLPAAPAAAFDRALDSRPPPAV